MTKIEVKIDQAILQLARKRFLVTKVAIKNSHSDSQVLAKIIF